MYLEEYGRNKTHIQVKYNLKRENQVIYLIINDGKKWHYLAVKNYEHYLEK